MNTDIVASQEFDGIRESNEAILWAGRPAHLPFIASGIPFLLLGLVWFAIDFFGFILPMMFAKGGGLAGFAIPFFALHLSPFWLSLLNMCRLIYVYKNTAYALTTRRLMFRGGFWGISYESVDLDQVADLQVSIGPLERPLGVGSIRINNGRINAKGVPQFQTFMAVSDPYEVYKEIKKVSLDAKTDWEYPNKLRPTENPGYKTTYTGK